MYIYIIEYCFVSSMTLFIILKFNIRFNFHKMSRILEK